MKVTEQRARLAEIRELATALNDSEDFGDDEQRTYDELMAEAAKVQAWLDRNDRLNELPPMKPEPVQQRGTPGAPAVHPRRTPDTESGMYCRYLRSGDNGVLAELNAETRASNDTGMNITTAADGGNAVPTGHYNGIIARRDEVMLRDRIGVMMIPGTGTTVNVPVDAEADGEFVTKGEMGDDNSTNAFDRDAPALGTVAMTLVKYTKKIEITDELLYDEDSRLMAFLENWVGKNVGRTHNSLLLTALLAGGTAGLILDAAAAFGIAEIPELVGKLMPEYQDNARWIMHPSTWAYLNGLNSANTFTFAPTPGSSVQGGGNGAGGFMGLWGFPLHTSSYATAYAAGVKSLVFGNYEYVGNREAPGLTFLRDPYTVDGKVILKYNFRTVYKVLQAEAVQYATHPTA